MRLLLALAVTLALPALADEFVTPSPGPAEVARFTISRTGTLTVRLDTMTGSSWYLCTSAKKPRQAWCRFRDLAGLPSGPVGRYRVSEGAPLVMLDTVSGRTWARCDMPTPEKGEAWCLVDE
jgi:hypothetical protein